MRQTSTGYSTQSDRCNAGGDTGRYKRLPCPPERGVLLLTTDYVLDESYTLLRSVLGHRVAARFGREVQRGGIEIVQIDARLQRDAWRIFDRYADKDFSFTDCTSFAVMELGRLRRAFTFDRHFEQYGFIAYPPTSRPRTRMPR
jgi:predicted nucleic acid-binding protein